MTTENKVLTEIDFARLSVISESEASCYEGFFYLATPYANLERKRALQIAARTVFNLLSKNIYVWSPILHTASINDYVSHELDWSHSDYLKYDSSLISKAAGAIFVKTPASFASKGMYAEYKYFYNNDKPMFKYIY